MFVGALKRQGDVWKSMPNVLKEKLQAWKAEGGVNMERPTRFGCTSLGWISGHGLKKGFCFQLSAVIVLNAENFKTKTHLRQPYIEQE